MTHSEPRTALAIRAAAAALGASAGIAGPEAAVAGAALTPAIEAFLLWLGRKNAERVAETMIDAVDAQTDDADTAEKLRRIVDAAQTSDEYQELLIRALTMAQETSMRDKRRALGRSLANAVEDTGTKVDEELYFLRVLASIDPVHVRVLKILSRRPPHLDPVAEQMNRLGDPRAVRQWYPWSVTSQDPGLERVAWRVLRELAQLDLASSAGEFLVPDSGMEPQYEITGLGEWLLERLAEPG